MAIKVKVKGFTQGKFGYFCGRMAWNGDTLFIPDMSKFHPKHMEIVGQQPKEVVAQDIPAEQHVVTEGDNKAKVSVL